MLLAVDDIALPDAPPDLDEKAAALAANLLALGRVAVAYSGGVDSALLLAVAVETLGDAAVALTAVSPSLPAREQAAAERLAADLGARHVLIATHETADPRYVANTAARCYFCKDVVYHDLADYAAAHDLGVLVDGMNRDDRGDHRPGRQAAAERGVRSPLDEAGFTKADVRALARRLGLPVWSKPAMACLSSRIPYGTPVTAGALRQIEAAEAALHDLGFRQVRVRQRDDLACVEVAPMDLDRAFGERDAIVGALRAAGYLHVALDLEGYRTGSLNAVLGPAMAPAAGTAGGAA
jgi:pyridinium-3,5-biscarboxylic acid mononucleotide sulfurtransferase